MSQCEEYAEICEGDLENGKDEASSCTDQPGQAKEAGRPPENALLKKEVGPMAGDDSAYAKIFEQNLENERGEANSSISQPGLVEEEECATENLDVAGAEARFIAGLDWSMRMRYGAILASTLTSCLLFISLIMLGTSIHRIDSNRTIVPQQDIKSYYFTVRTTVVNYSDIVADYSNAAEKIQLQIAQALEANTRKDVIRQKRDTAVGQKPSILGISKDADGSVRVLCAYSYLQKDAPTADDFKSKLNTTDLEMTNIFESSSGTVGAVDQQLCSGVSSYSPWTNTSQETTLSTVSSFTGTTAPAACPTCATTVTCPSVVTTLSTPCPACPSSITCPTTVTCPSPATCPTSSSCPAVLSSTSCPPCETTTSSSSSTTTTTGKTTSPTTTTTTPITPTTTTSTTTTTNVPPTCSKDIFLLIDTSNAMTDYEYDQLKSAIATTLIYKWLVAPGWFEVAPVTYAGSSYNQLADFDLNDVYELSNEIMQNTHRLADAGPNVARILKFVAIEAASRENRVVTLLISSSSNAEDVLAAKPYAQQLYTVNNTVITFAVGRAQSSVLGDLSSGSDFSFSSASFSFSDTTAQQIAGALCKNAPPPPTTTTTTPTPRPTTTHPDILCKSDIALMFDTSSALGSNDEYLKELSFLRDRLTSQWFINMNATEAALIPFGTKLNKILGAFTYADNERMYASFQSLVNSWYGVVPSIEQAFDVLTTLMELNHTRTGAQTVAILFTYSSGYDDIQTATRYLNSLADKNVWIYVVCKGNGCNLPYLNALSGSVVWATQYDDTLARQLNAMICIQNTPPGTLPPPPSTSTSSTTTPYTLAPTTTTTAGELYCRDCVPPMSNLLLLMEASNGTSQDEFEKERAFIRDTLTANWTHYERMAMGVYSNAGRFYFVFEYHDLVRREDFIAIMNSIVYAGGTPNVTYALQQAAKKYVPDSLFGRQRTVFFTSTSDQDDVDHSAPYAKQLKDKGDLVIIATGKADALKYSNFTAANHTLSWPDYNDPGTLSGNITGALSEPIGLPVTTTTGLSTTSSKMTTTATTSFLQSVGRLKWSNFSGNQEVEKTAKEKEKV